MPIDNKNELTLEELKNIIHGLRMSTLSFVEEGALSEINSMIKVLPLPEEIDKLTALPKAVKNLQNDIGNIMRLVELYGKRDIEFKTRYVSRTGLPPRYKVLEWRGNMKTDAKIIRDMVKVSSDVDSKGHGELSGRINKFASNILQDKFDETEFEKIALSLKESGLEKEAQFWQGVKNIGKGFGDWATQKVKGVGQSAKEMYQVGKYSARLDQMKKMMDQATKYLGDTIQQMTADIGKMKANGKEGTPRYQQMQNILTQLNAFYEQEAKTSQSIQQTMAAVKQSESAPAAGAPAAAGAPPAAGAPEAYEASAQAKEEVPAPASSTAAPKFAQNQTVYYSPKSREVLPEGGKATFLGYDAKGYAQIQLDSGKKMSGINPQLLKAQPQPVTASSKFNLRMYKSACAK